MLTRRKWPIRRCRTGTWPWGSEFTSAHTCSLSGSVASAASMKLWNRLYVRMGSLRLMKKRLIKFCGGREAHSSDAGVSGAARTQGAKSGHAALPAYRQHVGVGVQEHGRATLPPEPRQDLVHSLRVARLTVQPELLLQPTQARGHGAVSGHGACTAAGRR